MSQRNSQNDAMREKIIRAMQRVAEPMTINMIAKEIDVSSQTVRNHLPKLESAGKVEMSRRRIDRAMTYIVSDPAARTSVPIVWVDGKQILLRDIFLGVGQNGYMRNTYWQQLQMVITQMYRLSLQALDDDNPQSVTLSEARSIRQKIVEIRASARQIMDTADDLLNLDDLFIPRELPKLLIMQDTELDLEKATDIIDRINEGR